MILCVGMTNASLTEQVVFIRKSLWAESSDLYLIFSADPQGLVGGECPETEILTPVRSNRTRFDSSLFWHRRTS